LESNWRWNIVLIGVQDWDVRLTARLLDFFGSPHHWLALWSNGLPRLLYLNPSTGIAEDNGTFFIPEVGTHFPWGRIVTPD